MKSLVDVLLVIVAIAALGFAIYEFLDFVKGTDTGFTRSLLLAIVGFVVMCVCAHHNPNTDGRRAPSSARGGVRRPTHVRPSRRR
jgi:hypothetical protein